MRNMTSDGFHSYYDAETTTSHADRMLYIAYHFRRLPKKQFQLSLGNMDVMENKVVFAHSLKWDGKQAPVCPECFERISSVEGGTDSETRHRCCEMELKEALDYFRTQPVQTGRTLPRII